MRAAIVLAAGASRRFGRQNKLMTQLQGRALLDHALANARASGARRVVVVASRAMSLAGARVVRRKGTDKALSASLAVGLAALRPIEREVLIFLGDMPFARSPRMTLRPGALAVRPYFDGRPGHPMLVRAAAAREALASGDAGLAGKLPIVSVRGDMGNIIDIDTPAALRHARHYGSRKPGRRCTSS